MRAMHGVLTLGLLLAGSASYAQNAARYDLVITGGRVMDPETNTDRIANIGISGGRIAAISATPLSGARTVDAKGLVVAPGFIDLHSHAQYAFGYDQQVRDGVTTALELEEGVFPIKPFYESRQGKTRINFGASVGLQSIRVKIKTGMNADEGDGPPFAQWGRILPRKSEWAEAPLTADQAKRERAMFAQGFADGGLGMGVLSEYLPGAGRDEIFELMREAGRLHAPLFVHARATDGHDASSMMAPIQELIADAAATGAPLHICHIGSKSLGAIGVILELIDGARAHGVDVTTEVYPYDASSTAIGSAMYNEGWQERQGVTYHDVEWPATGERLTAESFAKYRKESPGTAVFVHKIPEQTVTMAVAHPGIIIASDAIPYINGAGHPRGTGTFARVLGVYVREKHALSLMTAISKMTLLPARRLEPIAPAMHHKGRVQVGADADLTLFDPNTVLDQATYQHQTLTSRGIPYVIVGGVPVVDHGEIVKTAYPGKGIRSGSSASR